MDAHKAKRKELDDFHDTFETDEEAIAWMRRYGVFPLRPPRFGAGTDAIRRIREACGVKQGVLANVCHRSNSRVSEWAAKPELVRAPELVRIVNHCESYWSGTPEGYTEFIRGLLNVDCMANPGFYETPKPWVSPYSVLLDAWPDLTEHQREVIAEIATDMAIANEAEGE